MPPTVTEESQAVADGAAEDHAFWAWDQYWRDGRLASCGGAGGAAYQAAITEGWREFFRTLPDGSRILDVCTGNGAIARVAEETAQERGIAFEIEAFDGAVIATTGAAGGMIRFRSRVRAESLPYAEGYFDAVVGQYGLEYSDTGRSVPELARVSAPGGRVRLMTHAREGVVVGQARRQLEDAGRLLASDIFPAARGLADAREAAGPDADLRGLTDRYNTAVRDLEAAAAQSIEPGMYSNACQVLTHTLSIQQQVGAGTVRDKIGEIVAMVRAHAARLDAMCRAALDEAHAKVLAVRIGELRARTVAARPARNAKGDVLGWIVESVRE